MPAKVVEKVKGGSFVDFKEFLADNMLLAQCLQSSTKWVHYSPHQPMPRWAVSASVRSRIL